MSPLVILEQPPMHTGDRYTRILYGHYCAWRDHHAVCHACHQHDWYNPGAPIVYGAVPPEAQLEPWSAAARTQAKAPAYADFMILPDGRTVFYTNAPDVVLLCVEG